METPQALSIESFSYSWLVNLNSSLESSSSIDEASFIEMDPKLSPSKRFFRVSHDLNFDFPISQSPLTLVHADELICNGFLMPRFIQPLRMEDYSSSYSVPTSPAQENVHLGSKMRRCRRLSKRIIQRYLDFLRPLCERIRGTRVGSRLGSFDTSPRTSEASDTSIYDAVLHCKRTIGNVQTESEQTKR